MRTGSICHIEVEDLGVCRVPCAVTKRRSGVLIIDSGGPHIRVVGRCPC